MTKDYKGRAQPKDKPAPKRNCIFWFISGALLGAFAVGLLWLQLDPALIRSGAKLDDKMVPRPKVDQNQPPPASGLDTFEYAGILENLEVLVTADEAVAPPPKPKPEAKPKPEPARVAEAAPPAAKKQPAAKHDAWVLQIGSFRKAADAEKLKARLAFMGIETRIQRIVINGKDTFHRVRSGPYHKQKELDQVRQLLTRNKIKSIVVRWVN